MTKDFVKKHLGPTVLSRDVWLTKNTVLVKTCFDLNEDSLALIGDGSYIYCEKSSNNSIQRLLYSGQKHRHLVKPFVLCSTNGRIIDVYGPYPATANDASILKHILETDDDLNSLLKVLNYLLLF